jgi:transposase
MGALQSMPEGAAERLASLLKEARSKAEYQRVQCVWLRATLGLNSRQVAAALGWQASSVRRTQARYLRQGEEALRDQSQGGRHHAHFTAEEEQNLLAPFLQKAAQGKVIVAAPVRQAYEAKLGHPVHPSVVYRALHRQGWRKIQPRPRPPKADAGAQEEFKKTSGPGPARGDKPSGGVSSGAVDV